MYCSSRYLLCILFTSQVLHITGGTPSTVEDVLRLGLQKNCVQIIKTVAAEITVQLAPIFRCLNGNNLTKQAGDNLISIEILIASP